MKQAEDNATFDLPLPGAGRHGIEPPADIEYGPVARAMLGLAPATPPALPAWLAALHAAVADEPAGKKGVAARLGVSRPYVSRVMCGDLKRRPPPKFIARVEAMLLQVDCPHLLRPLQPAECRGFAERRYAKIDQFEVDHWRACRGCTHNQRRKAGAARATTTTTQGEPA